MSEILIETENPTNRKPDPWYREFSKVYGYPIEFLKERDIMVDKSRDYKMIDQSAIRFFDEFGIHGINILEGNQQFLEECKVNLISLGIKISPMGVINLCSKTLQDGYLVSQLLRDIAREIHCFKKNEDDAKPILDILKGFKLGNYQQKLYGFIEQNTNWRKKNRDFEIYKDIQKGTLYSEIAGRLKCDISTISKINKKVQSSINNLKGKFFEIEFEEYLKSLYKFRNNKIVRDGNPGKPDIYIIDNIKKEIYIFSLKNLELNKESFCIIKEQLKPELEFAYLKSTFEEYNKIILYLIIFDSLTEQLHIKEVDYKNPSNINIHR